MLKPKRKITKKEIRQDPLLETINELQHKFVEYKPWIIRIGSAVVLLVAVVLFMQNSRTTKRMEGESMFGRALVSYEKGDFDNAQFQFEILAEEYSSYNSGRLGQYYLGQIAFDKEEFTEAETYLNQFIKNGGEWILTRNAHNLLAGIYQKTDQLERVEDHLKKAVSFSTNETDKYTAELTLAEFYSNNGETDKASVLLKTILDNEELSYNIKKKAEEISGGLLN